MSDHSQKPPDHSPDTENQESDYDDTTRRGLVLFTIYVILYGGYVLLTTFSPTLMESVVGGVSLSIIYGMGLIFAAFLLALVYAWLCRGTSDSKKEKP